MRTYVSLGTKRIKKKEDIKQITALEVCVLAIPRNE